MICASTSPTSAHSQGASSQACAPSTASDDGAADANADDDKDEDAEGIPSTPSSLLSTAVKGSRSSGETPQLQPRRTRHTKRTPHSSTAPSTTAADADVRDARGTSASQVTSRGATAAAASANVAPKAARAAAQSVPASAGSRPSPAPPLFLPSPPPSQSPLSALSPAQPRVRGARVSSRPSRATLSASLNSSTAPSVAFAFAIAVRSRAALCVRNVLSSSSCAAYGATASSLKDAVRVCS